MRRLLFVCLPLIGIISCKQGPESTQEVLRANDFMRVMDSLPDEQLIDVRTPEECAKGIISGARIININDADFEARIKELDREKPVMVYCRSGRRSATAAEMMQKLGFKKIFGLEGGTLAWYSAGLPLTSQVKTTEQFTVSYFDSLVRINKPVIVDFYAPWCAPCKRIEKSLEELKAVYADKIDIVRINVDDNPEFAKAMQIEGLPVLHLYRNGNKLWEKKSEASKAEMEAQLKAHF